MPFTFLLLTLTVTRILLCKRGFRQSQGSGSRSSGSRSQSRRYRRLAASSQVDETLFGRPKAVSDHPSRVHPLLWCHTVFTQHRPLLRFVKSFLQMPAQVSSHSTVKNPAPGDKETIQIITKDLIRTLRWTITSITTVCLFIFCTQNVSNRIV